jgi:lipid-A-disaccharide synthase
MVCRDRVSDVAPQFWARRQGHVRLLRDYVDKALVIVPFEEKFYRERAVDATFVGRPLAGLPQPVIKRKDYAEQFHLDPSQPWITIMPGSRIKEVRMNLPTILEAAGQLGPEYECLLLVAPTLARSFLQEPDKSTKHYAGSRIPARLVAFARRHHRQRHCDS